MPTLIEESRKARPNVEIGICGKHGGDPASIHFCNALGLNYVSCSRYRVPVARLAAAQAAMETKERDRSSARMGAASNSLTIRIRYSRGEVMNRSQRAAASSGDSDSATSSVKPT